MVEILEDEEYGDSKNMDGVSQRKKKQRDTLKYFQVVIEKASPRNEYAQRRYRFASSLSVRDWLGRTCQSIHPVSKMTASNIKEIKFIVTVKVQSVRAQTLVISVNISEPLCSLFITFCDMDNPQKEITTAHIFHTKQQRQYPQTRKVVYTPSRGSKNMYTMSASPAFIEESDDDDFYRKRKFNSKATVYPAPARYHHNQIVQEVAISYSAPLTISAPSSPLSRPLSSSERIGTEDYSSVQDYITDQRAIQPKPFVSPESVERVNARGRHETEFPVRIAYIGGESISPVHSVPITTVPSTYRGPLIDSRASTRLAESVVSETTTIQELTTITTTSHGRSVSSDMPGVTELAQRFERSSRSDSGDTGRTTPKAPPRVVVISKPGPEFVYSSDESKVRRIERPSYSPSDQKGVLSTTVVDIEPPSFRTVQPHYVEERYQLEEQYRSVKSYGGPKKEGYTKPREVVIPTEKRETRETRETKRETVNGHTVFSSRTERTSPTDQHREHEIEEIRGATPVRSVVEQFESRIEEGRKTPDRRPYYKEVEEITKTERATLPEREVYIPKSDLLPSRKTYTESITTQRTRKLSGSDRDQPYRGRREITREEVTRVPPYNGLRETLTEEVSRGYPYTETREVRREESEEEYRRRKAERERVVPVEKVETVGKEDVTMETMTTESVRTFPRVVVPKPHSPTPPRAVKSTIEIAKEEYKEERKQPEKPPRDFRETLERSERTERSEMTETTETYKRTGKMEDTTRTPASTPVPPLRAVTDMPSLYTEEHHHYSKRSGFGGRTPQSSSGMAHTGTSEFISGSSVTAGEIREIREREKREMRGLNDRLAAYIEQVRFLEAQNRKLNHDLERLTKGKHAPGIRMMYEKEIAQSQAIIADAKRDYGNTEKEVRGLTADLTDIRNRYDAAVKARNLGNEDDLIVKLCDLQAQICMTKRRNAVIDEECKRIRAENLKLSSDLAAQRQLLEKESLQRMNYEHQAQALIDECKLIASSNNVKLDKYKYQDTTEENRAIFRQGLLEAIAEIRKLYDEDTSKFRSEMESWYSKQVIEIRTSSRLAADASTTKEKVKQLRSQLTEMRTNLANLEGRNHILEKLIQDLNYQIEDESRVTMAHLSEKDDEIRAVRAQCQAITVELEKLIVEKVNLDAEISKYRQLLEGEENRTHGRVISTASHAFDTATSATSRIVSSSASRRVIGSTNRSDSQKSAQGNVSILDVAPDGSSITVENTSVSHDEMIGQWRLRSFGGGRDVSFTFPRGFVLTPRSKVTVYARGKGIHAPPHSLVFETEDSFATGGEVRTYLYNDDGQERARVEHRIL
ncbi:unnamed protein product [Cylicocyclus nassatus]|uniref:Uncharacterized protein n=1 Tax=Cylicocyclus nassatus TaxID=53992 RepID=A0AA36MF19_CYLNA|nr:unnamed protein product [Cylicocyclus nassatus]